MKERFEWETQRREALRLLGNLGQSLASESPPLAIAGIPVEQVVRLLDEADYRLVRSGDDLLNALVHMLRQVDEGAPYDLSMLYGRNEPVKPSRRSKGKLRKEPGSKTCSKKRRSRRMFGVEWTICFRRIPRMQIKFYREPEVKSQRRFDLEVVAPTMDRQWATVIIEIKWSDNKDAKSGLENQLVRNYLIGHGLSHGIYLVGWNGAWQERGQEASTDIQQLKASGGTGEIGDRERGGEKPEGRTGGPRPPLARRTACRTRAGSTP